LFLFPARIKHTHVYLLTYLPRTHTGNQPGSNPGIKSSPMHAVHYKNLNSQGHTVIVKSNQLGKTTQLVHYITLEVLHYITLHESYLQWLKYKTAKPLLYTVYRTGPCLHIRHRPSAHPVYGYSDSVIMPSTA